MNVWKIASRWSEDGNVESSILDIFRKYGVVFAGRNQEKIRENVKINDLIAISDGILVVAIGKVLDIPKPLTSFKFEEEDIDSERFHYEDWVVGFKVKIFDLKEIDQFNYRMGTFHGAGQSSNRIMDLYENYNKNIIEGKFSINAKTCTLKGENGILTDTIRYVIPVYQRPYSWEEAQIKKIIKDIVKSYSGEIESNIPEMMFIGTLQLSGKERVNEHLFEQEVIDGQQRLTTVLLILKVLKDEFPNYMKEINLNWLKTRVNSGKQQKYLQKLLDSELKDIDESLDNPYISRILLVKENLFELIYQEDGNLGVSIEKFVEYLFTKVYFVIIETVAGLSKTLEIFDAINTTGLDLNGGDVFKIRMYEYLRDIKNYDEKIFERISDLYAILDIENEKRKTKVSILEILRIYQYIIITENDLPDNLNQLATATFFDRLFDTIFNINKWESFSNAKNVELSLDKIEKIISVRFQWEDMSQKTTEDVCAEHLIHWSRYGRYWNLVYVYMYYSEGFNSTRDVLNFIKQINKLYIVFSVLYQKSVREIHNFSYKLIDKIRERDFKGVIKSINTKLLEVKKSQSLNENWNYLMSTDLTLNRKRKDLICRLSAMLEEDYNSNDINIVNEVKRKLFYDKIDIEHIQSYNDKNEEDREKIKEEWKGLLNSIGNLVVLESSINRSIGNDIYKDKLKCYKNSEYQIIQNQVQEYSENWSIAKAQERKTNEMTKINRYLFE